MEIKLDESERGWAWTNLEEVIELLNSVREFDGHDRWPLISADIEFMEHITAIFKETQCADCKQDFSK